jgi:hypothetical protein
LIARSNFHNFMQDLHVISTLFYFATFIRVETYLVWLCFDTTCQSIRQSHTSNSQSAVPRRGCQLANAFSSVSYACNSTNYVMVGLHHALFGSSTPTFFLRPWGQQELRWTIGFIPRCGFKRNALSEGDQGGRCANLHTSETLSEVLKGWEFITRRETSSKVQLLSRNISSDGNVP